MFFYNGHNSESEGGCENDDNDDGNGCEGSDGGDVFFTVVSLFTQKVDLDHLCVFVEEGSSKAKDHSL